VHARAHRHRGAPAPPERDEEDPGRRHRGHWDNQRGWVGTTGGQGTLLGQSGRYRERRQGGGQTGGEWAAEVAGTGSGLWHVALLPVTRYGT
jgi:hypothetical protein